MRNETAQKLSVYADILVRQKAQLGQTNTVTKESVLRRLEEIILDFAKHGQTDENISLARLDCQEAQRNYEAKQISGAQYRAMYDAKIGSSALYKTIELCADIICWFGAEQAKTKPTNEGFFYNEYEQPEAELYKEVLIKSLKMVSLVSLISLKITYNLSILNQN